MEPSIKNSVATSAGNEAEKKVARTVSTTELNEYRALLKRQYELTTKIIALQDERKMINRRIGELKRRGAYA